MDPSLTVREGLDRYLAARGFEKSAYASRSFVTRLGRVPLTFPNPGFLHLHDLHHVATGYSTDLLGEAEISCYEVRSGCRTALIWFFCITSIMLAFLLAPRRVMRAWRLGKGRRTLYRDETPYEELLAMSVGELRAYLALPAEGLVESC